MSVKVAVSPYGFLRLRVYWRGQEVVIGTKLRDDQGRNRQLLEAKALLIERRLEEGAELHRVLLAVLGDCPARLMPARSGPGLTVGRFIGEWLERLGQRRMRRSYLDRARTYSKSVITPYWENVRLEDVDEAAVEDFQVHVLARERTDGAAISVKTAKNIVSGLFAAIIRDARRRYRLPERDPFEVIVWPELRREDPDPFLPAERDRITDFFWSERRRWYPLVATLFWTGLRPSEAVALRVGDYDCGARTLRITRSRTEGEDRAPKTRASRRTIKLFPEAIHALEALPARPFEDPDAFLFVNADGGPIQQREWPKKSWYPVLERLKIRRRKFYATRHTFFSWLISEGEDLKAIAEYGGTSVAMIEQSYGRWIPKGGDGSVRSLRSLEAGRSAGQSHFGAQSTGTNDAIAQRNLEMVPRGIEGGSTSDQPEGETGEDPDLSREIARSARDRSAPKNPRNRRKVSERSGRCPGRRRP